MLKIDYKLLFELVNKQNIPIQEVDTIEKVGIFVSDENGKVREFTVEDLFPNYTYYSFIECNDFDISSHKINSDIKNTFNIEKFNYVDLYKKISHRYKNIEDSINCHGN